jgi:lactoylglutathione lyase
VELGTFSVSLAVQDLAAARTFYEALGFRRIDGNPDQNWLILENGGSKIGLFHGMFDENILTFNPQDARAIQRTLRERGITPVKPADETTEGPAHLVLQDPDGNTILIDQH